MAKKIENVTLVSRLGCPRRPPGLSCATEARERGYDVTQIRRVRLLAAKVRMLTNSVRDS